MPEKNQLARAIGKVAKKTQGEGKAAKLQVENGSWR